LKLSRVFAFAALLSLIIATNVWTTNAAYFQEGHQKQHGFNVRQYDDFHDVLHPLQHEALPNKDFKRIRAKATLLSKRGRAIVKLGVPRRTSAENRVEFKNELKKFKQALNKFTTEARHGTDVQLEASYNAVHDSFEMLAALLPRT
jgi:hypothetical protein